MKCIASLSYDAGENTPKGKRWVRVATLWWDEEQVKASLWIKGFVLGVISGKPFPGIENAPFIQGDLSITTGTYQSQGVEKTEYMQLGFVTTTENGLYQAVLRVIPLVLTAKTATEKVDGIWVPIYLDENEKTPAKPEPPPPRQRPEESNNGDDNDLPF